MFVFAYVYTYLSSIHCLAAGWLLSIGRKQRVGADAKNYYPLNLFWYAP